MKHVTFGLRSLLIGDEAADTLLEYAAVVAQFGGGDTVELAAINSDGTTVLAAVLLDSGTPLMAESTHSDLPEPVNVEVVAYMRHEIAQYHSMLLGRREGAAHGDRAAGVPRAITDGTWPGEPPVT